MNYEGEVPTTRITQVPTFGGLYKNSPVLQEKHNPGPAQLIVPLKVKRWHHRPGPCRASRDDPAPGTGIGDRERGASLNNEAASTRPHRPPQPPRAGHSHVTRGAPPTPPGQQASVPAAARQPRWHNRAFGPPRPVVGNTSQFKPSLAGHDFRPALVRRRFESWLGRPSPAGGARQPASCR